MTVLVDTNVLIAAFLTRGACHELIEHLVRNHQVVLSEGIIDEFRRVLTDRFEVPAEHVSEAESLLRSRFAIVKPLDLVPKVCRDPDDDHIVAAAVAANADVLVSGDADLLAIGSHEGVTILRPSEFWAFELGRPRE